MASEAWERKLLKALEERDLDGVMRLVDPAIVCFDGSDYETLKVKLGAFFEQVPSLEVRLLDRVAVDGQVELKTQVAFEMGSAEAPYRMVLFFLVGKGAKGYRITDIYDEGKSQQKHSPLYRPGFNWSGLPDSILDLVEQRCGVWAGEHIEVVRTRTMEIRFERDAGSPAGLWARFSLLRYGESRRIHLVHAGRFAAADPGADRI